MPTAHLRSAHITIPRARGARAAAAALLLAASALPLAASTCARRSGLFAAAAATAAQRGEDDDADRGARREDACPLRCRRECCCFFCGDGGRVTGAEEAEEAGDSACVGGRGRGRCQLRRGSSCRVLLRHRESKTTGAGAAVARMAGPTDEATGSGTPGTTDPLLADWRERIIIPAVAAGVVGAAFGLLSRHRARLGATRAAVTYAVNLAFVAGCYGGARELARDARATAPNDPMNSVVGGLASGAVLGRIQGGHFGAVKYAVTFAAAGTALDYTALKLAPEWHALKEHLSGKKDWFALPEWSPIQVLDEEALAKKKAREEKLFAQRALGKLDKEDP